MKYVVAITIRELIAIPDLRTWLDAGETGLDREVAWAHVCELEDPTEWLGEGDLLLTTGLGIPEAPMQQRAYLQRLVDAGLSGISIGDRMYAPPLAPAVRAIADELAFPLLITAYEVPFSAVVKAVAEANRSEEHARLLDTLRLYETVRQVALSASGADLIARLEQIVNCDLTLLDPARGTGLIPGAREADPDVAAALQEARNRRAEPMPAVLRLTHRTGQVMAVAVPASRPATMIVAARGKASPDLGVLRDVAAVVGFELEREAAERERRRHRGAEVLAGLLDGRLTPEIAGRLLSEHGLDAEPRVIAACRSEPAGESEGDLHARLEQRGVAHLLLRRPPLLVLLIPDAPGAVRAVREEADPATVVGLSGPLGGPSRVADAEREARWALEAGAEGGSRVVRYGDDVASFFLPRGLSEAERAVTHVLGDLLDYDREHHSDLVNSLRVFLSHNRSWKDAAAALQVHKQTLVYRMRRVEQLTGRHLDDTGDVAELWFSLKAADVAAPSPPPR
jgi:PucR family transcriptional regulator, purine catabolism regulatory protein